MSSSLLGPTLGKTHRIKQNDTDPPCRVLLLKGDNSAQPLVAGDQVEFRMTPVTPGLRDDVVGGAVVNDLGTGDVQYNFTAQDTAVAGIYNAEFVVTYAAGGVQTFPSEDYITVVVQKSATS